ncbi:MAG TPA: ATP synthase F1 subunit gamma [Thermodesulfobacteriota bacterium]|nr:ATP synthase F1 subunit gamma [Thermodesulfobacteriota bacterium]
MASLRQISNKISSVKGTRRIMSAMKLIAAVKLQKAQSLLTAYRPYSDSYLDIAKGLANNSDEGLHPLLKNPEEKKNLHLVFMTSDRGLCGSFNSSLIRKVETYLLTETQDYEKVKITFVGRKGRDHFKKSEIEKAGEHSGITERNYEEYTKGIADEIAGNFMSGKSDEVILIYNYFQSALTQEMQMEQLLPIPRTAVEEGEEETEKQGEYIFEPNKNEVLKHVLSNYVEVRVQRALLESVTSEHGSRMTAMENATRNADSVIRSLTLLFNKTRQASITTELMDIVNGTEALRKGGGMD